MKTGYIYKITSPSGKIYIGSTYSMEYRHRYYSSGNCKNQRKLYHSINKYGWENHTVEVVEEPLLDDMLTREAYWGEYYNVLGERGLNLILPKSGDTYSGVSEETRKRMRESKLGEKNSQYGKPLSEEHKQKIREFQTGRKHSEEHRRKVSENHAKNNSKLVLNFETGVYYDSAKEASESTVWSHSYLKTMMNPNNGKCNKTQLNYV